MRLTIRLLGTEVLHITTAPEVEYDQARDLSGGTTASDSICDGSGDRYMGFTNGREVGE